MRRPSAALDRHADGRGRADIIHLPRLTGCRKTEIVRPKRREVDGNRLRLEDGKTGPGTVYPSSARSSTGA